MKSKLATLQDRDIEYYMGMLLITGVITASVVVLIGAVIYLFQNPYSPDTFHKFAGEPQRLRNLKQILAGAVQFRGRALIQLGLVLLLATPVARVIFAVIGFTVEKDRMYTAVSLLVLIILLVSIFGII
jgi:uncharacterized membrane protein